jgi:eukaryotic-like serine/threonine-protein kinase
VRGRAVPLDVVNRTVGGYRLEKKLGQGGMGVVYRAVDTVLDRPVALKMIKASEDEALRGDEEARFLREAKAAARIQSRHVAQVLYFGKTDEGELYIVMELLDGLPLSKVLGREKRLSPQRAVRIARQIARGMQAAHQIDVVHRDLKPANVMIVTSDGIDEVAKILDFGVAKITNKSEKDLTRAGSILGTSAS